MPHINVTLMDDDRPQVRSLNSTGGHFIAVELGRGVSMYLPGYDQTNLTYGRALVEQLTKHLDDLEAELKPKLDTATHDNP